MTDKVNLSRTTMSDTTKEPTAGERKEPPPPLGPVCPKCHVPFKFEQGMSFTCSNCGYGPVTVRQFK